jgi:hypothetical protein
MTLLARNPVAQAPRRARAGCGCHGARDEAELVWRETARVDARAGVPLVVFDPAEDPQLTSAPAKARPLARPRVAAGATPPDGTPWRPFRRPGQVRGFDGVEVRVDTRAAGFTDMPCYFAWLHWPRLSRSAHPARIVAALGLQYVERCSIDGFTFRVWLGPASSSVFGEALVGFARNQRLFVSWLGVQTTDDTDAERSAKGKA